MNSTRQQKDGQRLTGERVVQEGVIRVNAHILAKHCQ